VREKAPGDDDSEDPMGRATDGVEGVVNHQTNPVKSRIAALQDTRMKKSFWPPLKNPVSCGCCWPGFRACSLRFLANSESAGVQRMRFLQMRNSGSAKTAKPIPNQKCRRTAIGLPPNRGIVQPRMLRQYRDSPVAIATINPTASSQ